MCVCERKVHDFIFTVIARLQATLNVEKRKCAYKSKYITKHELILKFITKHTKKKKGKGKKKQARLSPQWLLKNTVV